MAKNDAKGQGQGQKNAAAPAVADGSPYYDILICVLGTSPAVVTETLQALTRDKSNPFKPKEIHLITTTEGAKRFDESPRAGVRSGAAALKDFYSEFAKDYGLKRLEAQLHIVTSEGEEPKEVDDIRTEEDSIAAGNTIIRVFKDATRACPDGNRETRIHASIAGGRKTMSFYMGYAMMLLARPQDRLSHVLVDPFFESIEDFYYVSAHRSRLSGTDPSSGRVVSRTPSQEDIELGMIEFPLLGQLIPEKVIAEISDMTGLAKATQFLRSRGSITLRVNEKFDWNVGIGDEQFRMEPVPFALYRLVATCRRFDRKHLRLAEIEGVDRHAIHYSDLFIHTNTRTIEPGPALNNMFGYITDAGSDSADFKSSVITADGKPWYRLSHARTTANQTIEEHVPSIVSGDFLIASAGKVMRNTLELLLAGDRIVIVE